MMIIAAFPGTGKTTLEEQYPNQLQDTPTEDLVEKHGGQHTPMYHDEFADRVDNVVKHGRIALMLPIMDVMDRLIARGHDIITIIPLQECKDEYMTRYRERGSDEAFLEKIDRNWDSWLHLVERGEYDPLIRLKPGEYLSDVININKLLEKSNVDSSPIN